MGYGSIAAKISAGGQTHRKMHKHKHKHGICLDTDLDLDLDTDIENITDIEIDMCETVPKRMCGPRGLRPLARCAMPDLDPVQPGLGPGPKKKDSGPT